MNSRNSKADHGWLIPENVVLRTTPVMKIHHLTHNENFRKITGLGENLNIESLSYAVYLMRSILCRLPLVPALVARNVAMTSSQRRHDVITT